MIISEIGIRGYKSFGNNEQVLHLNTQKGELILLVGNNGNGKSSLLESFEFSLYGKVKSGKGKKWSTLKTLPNRINGELLNRIKFKSKGTDVEIIRGISPNRLELWENGILNERAGKSNIDDKIEEYIDMDIETFKSFMSMSVNDFKNFISLSTEEKQLLLDKLFNLEVINILKDILKELAKKNKERMTSLDSEISTLNESISSIQRSIQKSIEREKANTQIEIDKLKSDMESKKDEYAQLKEKVQKIKEKEEELNNELDTEKKQFIIIGQDIKNIQKDIDLYDSGKCPTCATPFDSEHFISLRSTLLDKKSSLENVKSEIDSNISKIRERQIKLKEISNKVTTTFNDITYFLKNCKLQLEKLEIKRKNEEGKGNENINEFYKTIEGLEDKKIVSSENIFISKEKELYYKELNRIFGEDGVKKSIINGIIKPINHFITENVKKMGLKFEVQLDDTFTARIKHLGSIIDPESLSTGEHKLINICILCSYLSLIRTKKNLNILFLDEVFSSVDLDNIQKILILLKSFASDHNVNIFVVHHAVLNHEMFDRILRINKEVFSSIEELYIKD
jgi:DNA repair exonuclease SbcCD ATPase subunit